MRHDRQFPGIPPDAAQTIATLEKRLAIKRTAMQAMAQFAGGVTSDAPLEVLLRDQLHQWSAALGISGGAVVLDDPGGDSVTWVFGTQGLAWASQKVARDPRLRAVTAPETIDEPVDVWGRRRRTWLAPIAWSGHRLGVLALMVPDGESVEDLQEAGQALAAQIAQAAVLHEAFDRIRRQEERYRQIFDSALVGIYQSTPAGHCVVANLACARYLGFDSPAELMEAMNERGYDPFADPADRADFVRRLKAGDLVEGIEVEAVRRDGTRVWLRQTAQAVRNDEGQIVRIDGMVQDVDERRRAELALAATQQRLDGILATSPAMSFVMRWEGDGSVRPLWVSDSVRQITGYSPEESCSHEWWATHVHPEDRPSNGVTLESLRRGGRAVREYRFRHRDGTYRWVRDEEKVARVLADGGFEVVGCWIDITEQKQAEEARTASDRIHRALVEKTPIGIGRCDAQWRIVEVNPALAHMLGYADGELIGRSFGDVSHPDDVALGRSLWEEVARGERDHYQVEKRYVRKDGSPVWVNLNVSVLRTADGAVEFGIGVVQDITSRKNAERDLEHRRQVLSQAEKMADMGALLAGVAHELNNPLSVVIGQAQLIGREAGAGPLARRAQMLDQAADRCARIVHNFLSLARQRPPERTRVSANQVVREALELIAYPLRVDGVQAELELAPTLPPLWADPHQLHQVVVNLVTNAQHAVRAIDGPRRVTIKTEARADGVRLRIADSGPGVPDAIRARIFEPFFTTKPQGQGTGLGLPLCLGIIEAHGGRLSLEPYRSGAGAEFVIDLPLGTHPHGEAAAPVTPASVPRRSILVVDDEVAVAAVLAELLTDEGHAVDVASGGAEGVQRLAEKDYDVVVTDMKMPGVGGPALYAAAIASARRVPAFVFMTGDALTPETSAFLAEPGRVHLEKPFRTDTVRQALNGLFAHGSRPS